MDFIGLDSQTRALIQKLTKPQKTENSKNHGRFSTLFSRTIREVMIDIVQKGGGGVARRDLALS